MCQDNDIKIAGDHPSKSLQQVQINAAEADEYRWEKEKGNIDRAQRLGALLAKEYVAACKNDSFDGCAENNDVLDHQKILLLSFTVTVALENQCPATCTAKIAKAAFMDELKNLDAALQEKSSDTGAFSFYYLSYRRGTEVDRRIGQTFAMLCSHDGDPIFQELGEAIYCWFSSVVNKTIREIAFVQ